MRIITAVVLGVLMWSSASAALIDDINALRARGCNGHPGVSAKLLPSRELDAVAKEWSRGGRLREALARTGYRAINSASMRIEGAPDKSALLRALADNYCDTLTNPLFTTAGIAQKAKDVHIVVALPFVAPAVRDSQAVSEQVLALVNAARAQPRKCGNTRFAAVPPLSLSAMLNRTALIHAQDMAANDFFEHQGSDGSTVAVRATRVGYVWRNIGENIAAGPATAEVAVKGWLDSPGHCANIMAPAFKEMGVAFATNTKGATWIYWAQVFGTRRQ